MSVRVTYDGVSAFGTSAIGQVRVSYVGVFAFGNSAAGLARVSILNISAFGSLAADIASNILPGLGAITFTGFAPVLSAGVYVTPGAGAITFTGFEPVLSADVNATPGLGAITLIGTTPVFRADVGATPGSGAITLTGATPAFGEATYATPGAGAITLTGYAPDISVSSFLAVGAGSISVAGYPPDFSNIEQVFPGVGAIAFAGFAPVFVAGVNATPGAGSLTLTGAAPTLALGVNLTPGFGAVTFTGKRALFGVSLVLASGVGAVTFTGFAPTFTRSVNARPGAGAIAFTGRETNTSIGPATVKVGRGLLRFLGYRPRVNADAFLTPGAGSITFGETGDLGGAVMRPGAGAIAFFGRPPNLTAAGAVIATLVQQAQADVLVHLFELDATLLGGSIYRWTPGPFAESLTGRLTTGGTTTVVTLDRELDTNTVIMDYVFIADLQSGLGIQQAPVASFATVAGVTEVTLATPLTEAPLEGSPWTLRGAGNVVFNGNIYEPLPIEADGFEMTGKGQLPTPMLRLGNNPAISALIKVSGDLLGAKVTRLRTFKRFLDGMPQANPAAILAQPDIYRVDRKARQSRALIEFELAAWTDQQGIRIPRRQVIRDTCTHSYRRFVGSGYVYGTCPYNDDAAFDVYNNPTGDPAADSCPRKLKGCVVRFGESANLPFAAFPGVAIA